jgi:subtilisin family serine protease
MIRCWSVVACLFVVLGAALPSSGGPAQNRTLKPGARERVATSPKPPTLGKPAPTDFYWFEGQRIPLIRSQSQVAIRVRPDADAATLPDGVRNGREVRSQGRVFRIVDVGPETQAATLEQFRGNAAVEVVAGVFEHPLTGSKMVATDEIVVKLRPGMDRAALEKHVERMGLVVVRALWGTRDEFVLRLADGRRGDAIEHARSLYESKVFAFAEPNFIRQYRKTATPNDTLFTSQWHLNNTGQGGGTAGADVDAVTAWNTQTGNSNIVIAIVDDGVETTHEDLAANIFVNPGEVAANGIDDDHNGYVDDVSGWDFSNNDNNANPFDIDDVHGTSVAGIAAARGDNTLGVTGACQTCRILPVKIFSPDYAGDTAVADALRYAASLADVVNNSWGGGGPSATLQSAIQTGTTQGRAGKGSALMFSAGNDAGGNFYISASSAVVPAGTHRFRWSYEKDVSLVDGEDSAWLSWVLFPGSALINFESGMPAGFTTGGNGNWTVVTDPRHSDEGLCFVKAAKAPALGHNQSSYIEVVKTITAGTFYSYQWVSSEEDFDGLYLDIDLGNNGTFDVGTGLISGVPFIDLGVAYPAAHPESIAVGSSTNFDCRSDYSQFGPELAFVAPSSGGPLNLGTTTTDRTSTNGYDPTNYTSTFGGTSSAAPLASGVAGLLLSRNPTLTVSQLLTSMKNSADKVGPEPYVSGRNDRYGFGRINANAGLLSIGACAAVSVGPFTLPNGAATTAYNQQLTASGGTAAYTYAVTVGSLPPGLTLSASGLLAGTPTTPGTYSFSVRSTDAASCTGHRAFHMVVTVAPPAVVGTSLYIVTPCRVVDSRSGTPLVHLTTRDIQFTGVCGIPSSATAVVANLTAVNPITTGFLALYPTGTTWPGTSTMNYRFGKTRANNAVLPLSNLGKATILNNGSTQHFIIDVTGYFQ